MKDVVVAKWFDLEELKPAYALVATVDLVTCKWDMHQLTRLAYGGVAGR